LSVSSEQATSIRWFNRLDLVILAAIGTVAIAVRWVVSCESFWTDELHSAWTVSAGWQQIGERASQGNQQPFFFYLLWLWTKVASVGIPKDLPLEAIWRIFVIVPSVLTAVGITWSLMRATGSRLGATAAGFVMAVDTNAIFFGTELRPYAWVMFLSWVTIDASSRYVDTRSTDAWWTIHAAAATAGLMHLTSLLSLSAWVVWVTLLDVLLPIGDRQTIGGRQGDGHSGDSFNRQPFAEATLWRRQARPRWRHMIVIAGWCCLLAWQLISQQAVWKAKANWGTFGTPTSIADWLALWPWGTLVLIPAVAWLSANRLIIGRWFWCYRSSEGYRVTRRSVALLAVGVPILSAVLAFGLAKSEFLPIWHRRYLVAAFPMLVWWFGWCIGSIANFRQPTIKRDTLAGRLSRAIAVTAIVISSLTLLWDQHTLPQLYRGDIRWVHRGEGWREAVAWITRQAKPGELVWVDPGLIEQPPGGSALVGESSYLKYVISGPYQFPAGIEANAVGQRGSRRWLDLAATGRPSSDWLISRRHLSGLTDRPVQPSSASVKSSPTLHVERFGRVWVTGVTGVTGMRPPDD